MRRAKQLHGSICVAQVLQRHNCCVLQAPHARQAICQLSRQLQALLLAPAQLPCSTTQGVSVQSHSKHECASTLLQRHWAAQGLACLIFHVMPESVLSAGAALPLSSTQVRNCEARVQPFPAGMRLYIH